MGKVIFYINPFHGHVNPTLGLVRELVRRGEEVIYYSQSHFQAVIEKAGAHYRCYQDPDGIFNWQHKPPVDSFENDLEFIYKKIAVVFAGPNQKMAEALYQEAKGDGPDYIVYDYFDGIWGKRVAEMLGVPAISSVTTFAICDKVFEVAPLDCLRFFLLIPEERMKALKLSPNRLIHILSQRIASALGINKVNIFEYGNSDYLNIVYTSRFFQPYGELFGPIFRFIGCTSSGRGEEEAFPFEKKDDQPLIYISLGTTVANQNEGFYRECVKAFTDSKYQIIMSVGNRIDIEKLGEIPGNFMVRQHAPQLAVLKQAGLFITHGGMNSASEALSFGVPLVVYPQQGDQYAVANRVAQLGAGISLADEDITANRLREAAEQVVSDPRYRQKSIEIGATIQLEGNLGQVADEILKLKA